MNNNLQEILSNWATMAAAAGYFVALLVHLAEWASRREAAVTPTEQPVLAGVGAAATDGADAVDGETRGPRGSSDAVDGSGADTLPPAVAKASRLFRLGVRVTWVAAVAHLAAVVLRSLAAEPVRVPWGNMYEFTLTSTLVVALGYLLVERRSDVSWLAPVVNGFNIITLMAAMLLLYTPVTDLQDALRSPWLVIHVFAAIIATGAFTLGGMASALYILKENRAEKLGGLSPRSYLARVPSLERLDRFAYRAHAFAFPVWTFAALITGPIWAQAAWGRYWGWDPKEVWAFITWVVYAAYLHARATAGWKGKAAAIIALIGLATLWFNFVGINFFFGSGSQHSYA